MYELNYVSSMSFGVTACLLSPPSLFPSCNLQLQQWDLQLQARPSFLLASPADTAAADSFCGVGFNTIDEAACLRPSIYPSVHCTATWTVQSGRGWEQSLILPLYDGAPFMLHLHGFKNIISFTRRQGALNHSHIFTSISRHHLLYNYSKDG